SLAGNMAAIEYIKNYNLLHRVELLSKTVEERFKEWRDYDNIYQARGWGLLKAVDFREAKDSPLPDYKAQIHNELFQKGVVTMGGGQGRYMSLLRIIPPFTIPKEQLKTALDIFEEVIR
ncbi:MAG: aminotransferase class III-fold pyridoxal phosphate-dependent enzyme, partial [Euryarchaeota archaeon]|nr:aminotransferase class III-fold pyridoxal phosphate-dependent enzyme [Euryarchaeota archaeon]